MELLANYNRVIDQHIHQGTLQQEIGQICRDALLQAMEATPNLGKCNAGSSEQGRTVNYPIVQSEATKNLDIPLDTNASGPAPEQPAQYDDSQWLEFLVDFGSPNTVDRANSFSHQPSLLQVSAEHEFSFPGPNPGSDSSSTEQSTVPDLEPLQTRNEDSNFLPFYGDLSDINFEENNQALDEILACFGCSDVDFLGSAAFPQSQHEQNAAPLGVAGPDGYHLDYESYFNEEFLEAHLAQENKIPLPAGQLKDKNIGNRLLHKHSSFV
jgi:hypothetical protein